MEEGSVTLPFFAVLHSEEEVTGINSRGTWIKNISEVNENNIQFIKHDGRRPKGWFISVPLIEENNRMDQGTAQSS